MLKRSRADSFIPKALSRRLQRSPARLHYVQDDECPSKFACGRRRDKRGSDFEYRRIRPCSNPLMLLRFPKDKEQCFRPSPDTGLSHYLHSDLPWEAR